MTFTTSFFTYFSSLRRTVPLIASIISLSLFCHGFTAGAEEILWPIDYYRHISSSFGEPRPGRFHYGLDFKSGGVIGKKIYALGDGYILQVRTTPFGYGKSLYIKLDTGEIIVYGHLSKYTPEIEDILFNLRIKNRTYDVTWQPPAHKYRVNKGDVIAYSGRSGGSTPHLHLEIRDADNNPLNPLVQGVDVRDTVPPRIDSVVLIPLDNRSAVDGFPVPIWIDFTSSETIPNKPVHLSGRIGVAASAWDRVNDSNNVLGVYRLSLAAGSEIVFSKTYGKLSYLYNGMGALDYLPGDYYGGRGSISALFRRTGNFLDFYSGEGILTNIAVDTDRTAGVTVTAVDFANNTTERTVPVVFGAKPVFVYCGYTNEDNFRIAGTVASGQIDRAEIWESSSGTSWTLVETYFVMKDACDINFKIPETRGKLKVVLTAENTQESAPAILAYAGTKTETNTALAFDTELLHDRIIVRISADSRLSSLPVIETVGNGNKSNRSVCAVPTGEASWIASVPLNEGTVIDSIAVTAYDTGGNGICSVIAAGVTVLSASSHTTVHSADGRLTIDVPAGTLYRPAPVKIFEEGVSGHSGLKYVSGGYRILLGDKSMKGSIRARYRLDEEPPEKAALFFANGNENSGNGNRWRYTETVRSGTMLSGDIGGSACVAILTDETPPAVLSQSPRSGGTIRSRKPTLSAYVEDKGCGLEGSNSFAMSIDEIPVYGEYDPARHTITYTLHNDLSPGRHTVRLTATDRLGNAKSIEWSFTIAP